MVHGNRCSNCTQQYSAYIKWTIPYLTITLHLVTAATFIWTCVMFSSPVGSLCHTPGVVCRLSSFVRRVSSVSTITTTNNEAIKSILSANVYHVPGLCLLGIGGAPYIRHKIMARKAYFHIFDFFSETTSRWRFILYQKVA